MAKSDTSDSWISATRRRPAARSLEKPATKAGQIRALWPEIRAALDCGQSMKSIRIWLEEDASISVAITSLTSYISRIRRREAQKRQEAWNPEFQADSAAGKAAMDKSDLPARRPAIGSTSTVSPPKQRNDPLAQAMQALSKPKLDIREIHGDGDPRGKNLI
jgi:hypothetical protein